MMLTSDLGMCRLIKLEFSSSACDFLPHNKTKSEGDKDNYQTILQSQRNIHAFRYDAALPHGNVHLSNIILVASFQHFSLFFSVLNKLNV